MRTMRKQQEHIMYFYLINSIVNVYRNNRKMYVYILLRIIA